MPYRVYFLDGPPRLVLDFREIDFAGSDAQALVGRELVPALRWGRFRPGWSRMVMELPGPYALTMATQSPDQGGTGGALVKLRIDPVAQDQFVTRGNALSALWICRRLRPSRRCRRAARPIGPCASRWTPAMAAMIPVPRSAPSTRRR